MDAPPARTPSTGSSATTKSLGLASSIYSSAASTMVALPAVVVSPSASPEPNVNAKLQLRSSSYKSFSALQRKSSSTEVDNTLSLPSPLTRPLSMSSTYSRVASEECRALAGPPPLSFGSALSPTPSSSLGTGRSTRASMILYRLDDGLPSPTIPQLNMHRASVLSTSGDSYVSLSPDSKYPLSLSSTERGLVAYAWEPDVEEDEDGDDDLVTGDVAASKSEGVKRKIPWRGIANIVTLVVLIMTVMSLFVIYPVTSFFTDSGRDLAITLNERINSTGQADFHNMQEIDNSWERRAVSLRGGSIMMVDTRSSELFRSITNTVGDNFKLVGSIEDISLQRISHPRQFILDRHLYAPESKSFDSRNFCLGKGFIEVGLMEKSRKGVVRRAFWTSGKWAENVPSADLLGDHQGVSFTGSAKMDNDSFDVQYLRLYRYVSSNSSGRQPQCQQWMKITLNDLHEYHD